MSSKETPITVPALCPFHGLAHHCCNTDYVFFLKTGEGEAIEKKIKRKKNVSFQTHFLFFLKPEKKVLIAGNKNKLKVVSESLSSTILYTPLIQLVSTAKATHSHLTPFVGSEIKAQSKTTMISCTSQNYLWHRSKQEICPWNC